MNLNPSGLSKLPSNLSENDCYSRIYDWHKNYGMQKITSKYGGDYKYAKVYSDLVSSLPIPSKATSADCDFIFGEVISGKLEWAYSQEDGNGIKMADYAHHALMGKYINGLIDPAFQANRKTSPLYLKFGYNN